MTRDQMEAHLTLHGWEPMGHANEWSGVLKEGVLLHVWHELPARRVFVTKNYTPMPERQSKWENIRDSILLSCYQHIMENKL